MPTGHVARVQHAPGASGLTGDHSPRHRSRVEQRLIVTSLRDSCLFENADETTLEDMARQLHRRRFRRNETIFHQGDPGDSLHIVSSGAVKIVLPSLEGEEAIIATLRSGDFFGELALLDGAPRSATAVALEASSVFELPGEDFAGLLTESPELAADVLHNMSAQLRRANDRLVARNSNSAMVRTGNMLVELSSLMMRHSGCVDRCELPITQIELADWIGATRESTARALARYRKAGLVETSRGKIVICDVLGLDQMIAAA